MRTYKDIFIFNKLVYCFAKLKQHSWKLDYDYNQYESYIDLIVDKTIILIYYNLKEEIIVFPEQVVQNFSKLNQLINKCKSNAKKI